MEVGEQKTYHGWAVVLGRNLKVVNKSKREMCVFELTDLYEVKR